MTTLQQLCDDSLVSCYLLLLWTEDRGLILVLVLVLILPNGHILVLRDPGITQGVHMTHRVPMRKEKEKRRKNAHPKMMPPAPDDEIMRLIKVMEPTPR